LKALGVRQIRGDIRDYPSVKKALQGVDTVFHTAALPGIWGPYENFYQTNVIGTQNIITGCKENGVSFLVHTSSPSVVFDGSDMEGVDESIPYPASFSAYYPQTKAMAEKLVKQASINDLHTIILRPHLIWGPRDNHLVPRIIARSDRLRIIGKGDNLVDTTYIDNAADAHLSAARALEKRSELSGKVYFISNDEPMVVWEIINGILAAAGLPPVTKRISARTARFAGTFCESLYKTLNLSAEPPMTRFVSEELATSHWFDISAAKNDLGYKPIITIKEGLKRLEHWLSQLRHPMRI
jgi:nucleoside-diphosphate-sugar epimerase